MTNKEDTRREESRERLSVRKEDEQKLTKKQLALQAKIAHDKTNVEHM